MTGSPNTTASAVIVGGGLGSRFGGDKLTLSVAGQPVLAWTLSAFERTPGISSIVMVSPSGREEEFSSIAREAGISKLHAVVTGGASRHESVIRGLQALPEGTFLAAIHDAARPLVSPELITRCLEKALEEGGAAAAAPVTDTLHLAGPGGYAAKTIDREGLWAMQTPQVFRAGPLLALLEGLSGNNPTDEVSAALAAGWSIPLVPSHAPNPKVTWESDLAVVAAFLEARS